MIVLHPNQLLRCGLHYPQITMIFDLLVQVVFPSTFHVLP